MVERVRKSVSWRWLLVGVAAGALAMHAWAVVRPRPADDQALQVFRQAYELTRDRYVVASEAEPLELVHDAIRGMIQGLGDTGHSRFLTPEQRARETQGLSGRITGIGVQMTERDGQPVVLAAFPESPAARAGIGPGDRFIAVNGEDVSRLSLADLGRRLQGRAGEEVDLTVLHPDGSTASLAVERAPVQVPSVAWAPLADSGLWHIAIRQFSRGTAEQLDDALAAADAAGATGIVLDLRDNPGGYLTEAVAVAGRFLTEGTVLIERGRDGGRRTLAVEKDGKASTLPLVVLVNESSASSSEVVSAALQHHGRATVAGTTTFGTGTVLHTFPLADGSALVLGVDEWLTPAGEPLRGRGVKPDAEAMLPEDARPLLPVRPDAPPEQACAGEDSQLQTAIALLGAGCGGVAPSVAAGRPAGAGSG